MYYLTDDLDYHTYVALTEKDVIDLGLKDLDYVLTKMSIPKAKLTQLNFFYSQIILISQRLNTLYVR